MKNSEVGKKGLQYSWKGGSGGGGGGGAGRREEAELGREAGTTLLRA